MFRTFRIRVVTLRVWRRKETKCHDWCLEKQKINVAGQGQPKHQARENAQGTRLKLVTNFNLVPWAHTIKRCQRRMDTRES